MKPFADATPTNYIWVSATGSNAGKGTVDSPFKTIQAAVDKALPGTAIMVQAGTYVENVKLPSNGGGTIDKPIWLVSAEGQGAAKIVAADNAKSTIVGLGTDNYVVSNFAIQGGANGIQFGMSGTNFNNTTKNIVIEGNIISNSKGDGVKISQGINIHVLDNKIMGSADQGVDFVAVNNSVIARNTVIDTKGAAGIFAKGGSTDVLIADNYVKGSGADGIIAGGWTTKKWMWPGINYEAKGVTIEGNVIEDVLKRPVNVLGAIDTIIQNNFLEATPKYYTVINVGSGSPAHSPPPVSINTTILDNVITRTTNLVNVEKGSTGVVTSGTTLGTAPTHIPVPEPVEIPMTKIIGTSANNTLVGSIANDFIDGRAGADKMSGGKGDDTYIVDNIKDVIVENSAEGNDTVLLHATMYRLQNNVENMIAMLNQNTSLIGNSGANVLVGNAGDDVLIGRRGNDTMTGGGGRDHFMIDIGDGKDIITDFSVTQDTVALRGFNFSSFADLQSRMKQLGADTVITLSATDTLTLRGVSAVTLSAQNFGFVEVASGMADGSVATVGTKFQNRVYGDKSDSFVIGTDRNDLIDGRAGNDVMAGGKGDDFYMVSSKLDRIVEKAGEGIDTIDLYDSSFVLEAFVENLNIKTQAGANVQGNELANIIVGGAGNDIISGGVGRDLLSGGAGADTFVFGSLRDAGDRITDFTLGVDRLDFRALAATTPGVTFTLSHLEVGTGVFAHVGDTSTLMATLERLHRPGMQLSDVLI